MTDRGDFEKRQAEKFFGLECKPMEGKDQSQAELSPMTQLRQMILEGGMHVDALRDLHHLLDVSGQMGYDRRKLDNVALLVCKMWRDK